MYRPLFNTNQVPLINITNEDYLQAAKDISKAANTPCDINVIKAVAAIESAGSGFLPTGEPKILFEPHIFWQRLILNGQDPALVLRQNPQLVNVLYKGWKTKPYGKPSEQWDRLRLAATVNINAAYESASFGKFQIMGYHFDACGYSDIFTFAHYFNLGEKFHLQAFVNFIIYEKLAVALATHNWALFASRYNGKGYHNSIGTILDDYDYLMNKMFLKLQKQPK